MKKLSSIIHCLLSIAFITFVLLALFLFPRSVFAYETQGAGTAGSTWLYEKQQAAESESMNLDRFIIGRESVEEGREGDTGVLPAVVGGLNLLALGPPDQTTTTRAGAVGDMGNLIASMIANPAVNTSTYIADVMNNMGLVTPAYAQDEGTGWTALNSVLVIWKAFRNIAYLGFVIIFVVVGFMIMFRAQINPQTVVTVQAALPKIVFTLLLVTFSYAIVSLMIDLIYVLIYLMVGVLGTFGVIDKDSVSTLIGDLLSQNAFSFIWQLLGSKSPTTGAAHAVGEVVNDIVGNGGLVEWVAKAISEPLAYLIIAVAILISLFKLFFQLLMAYLGIIFSVIFAPITLLFNALPNSNSFSSWLKGLFANAIIFPVVALLFVLAGALTGSESFYVSPDVGFRGESSTLVLPFVGGGFDTGAMQALIGIGCIMIMPKIVEMVQKMLGIEGGFAGIAGGALAPVAGAWGGLTWGPKRGWGAYRGMMDEEERMRQQIQVFRGTAAAKKWGFEPEERAAQFRKRLIGF